MSENFNQEFNTPEKVIEAYQKNLFPLVKMEYSKFLGKEVPIYNYENKSNPRIIYEILHLPLPNGNKLSLILGLINRIKEESEK